MTAREQGFLLLTGYLGDPNRRPLTLAQFRHLTALARSMEKPEVDRDMTIQDLVAIGCDPGIAQRVLGLLSQKDQLQWYLEKGRRKDCFPVTRISEEYPHRLRKVLDADAPGCLWTKGDQSLLGLPSISLVGSRVLNPYNHTFAAEVGKQAASQGLVLVSGNARGADRTAQESCLAHGGKVISVVADQLENQPLQENVLYLSEEGFDLPFSSQRALQRNRIIHSLSDVTFVAQSTFGKGGTWSGTSYNLRMHLSTVACFDDGTDASRELINRGAIPVSAGMLDNLRAIKSDVINFIDR